METRQESEANGANWCGATIVVADDDGNVRSAIAKLLWSCGHIPLEVTNGQEAIDRIRQGGVDLLITDLVMPEKEGIETIQELHGSHPQLPILAISGSCHWSYLKTVRMLGARATLSKPIEAEELLAAVGDILPRKSSGTRTIR